MYQDQKTKNNAVKYQFDCDQKSTSQGFSCNGGGSGGGGGGGGNGGGSNGHSSNTVSVE